MAAVRGAGDCQQLTVAVVLAVLLMTVLLMLLLLLNQRLMLTTARLRHASFAATATHPDIGPAAVYQAGITGSVHFSGHIQREHRPLILERIAPVKIRRPPETINRISPCKTRTFFLQF